MALNDVTTVITTVGFPIAAFIGLGWFMVSYIRTKEKQIDEMNKTYNTTLTDILERDAETREALTEALMELKNTLEVK